jgi:murein DD-endopeptidase MepM/ murein hydrolase activator NlpD
MGNHRAQRAPRRRTSAAPVAGKRRGSASRSPLLVRSLPSAPLLAGVAALAISIGGAVTSADTDLVGGVSGGTATAAGSIGTTGSQVLARRGPLVSRDSRRDAQSEGVDAELVALAEKQAAAYRATIADMRAAAEKQAAKIEENKWVLPLVGSYQLTATFGQYGLWASYHTGLDFNANTGDPILAVANGTITETGYDGAYGNKTVLTLDDGTEIWFCHQTSVHVSVGEQVRGGDVIGTVGVTGNVTGSHLHLEVRPGGGEPVDPFDAFVDHGIVP